MIICLLYLKCIWGSANLLLCEKSCFLLWYNVCLLSVFQCCLTAALSCFGSRWASAHRIFFHRALLAPKLWEKNPLCAQLWSVRSRSTRLRFGGMREGRKPKSLRGCSNGGGRSRSGNTSLELWFWNIKLQTIANENGVWSGNLICSSFLTKEFLSTKHRIFHLFEVPNFR